MDKKNRVAIAQATRTDIDDPSEHEDFYYNPGDLAKAYQKFKEIPSEERIEFIKQEYKKLGQKLHPVMEELISEYLSDPELKLKDKLKVPGLHAEVQAVNAILNQIGPNATKEDLKNISVATIKLQPKGKTRIKQLGDFPACDNCTGILHGNGVHIITGAS